MTLAQSPLWQQLTSEADAATRLRITDLFKENPSRFKDFSFRLEGMFVDFSKNLVSEKTLSLLLALARECGVEALRDKMFLGDKINTTEDRAVLHTRLRSGTDKTVTDTLARMSQFAESIRHGHLRGFTGKEITDIVNIGIGGSSLGPEAATLAVQGYHHMRLRTHFVSNVEASDLHHALQKLSPETTLFIIASKTFTTAETMQNAEIARDRLLKHFGGDTNSIQHHFVAVTTNILAAQKFGIPDTNVFPFWDWVGGRYSVWSAVGLSMMLMIGAEKFTEFLDGAKAMDTHFQTAPLERNIPAILALIGIWHRNFCDYRAYACIPYHAGLKRFPAWLQQLDMESNGKFSGLRTGPMIMGEPGTDAQHSFFQWLHQGTDITPVEFIAAVNTPFGNDAQQTMLLSNILAQAEALMTGKENKQESHRHFHGNRPSTMILVDELSPRTLGMLMALYEHKVFVQGAVWGINSFDQWGVELGKELAKHIGAEIKSSNIGTHDASTGGLISHILELKNHHSVK